MEVLVLFIFIFLFGFSLVSRGYLGESKAKFDMWLALNPAMYHRLHNVIIPSKNGTAQIDHILVSTFGVFIVETKNIRGWIFGSDRQPRWTQSLYGNKYSFQNPVRQTFRQKRILAEHLGLDEAFIHIVIYFVGSCTFKTDLPSNVINHGLGSYIKQYQEPIISDQDVDRITKRLKALSSDPSLTTRQHVKSLDERHGSYSICPKCGADLVERLAKRGAVAGSRFLGCRNYPRCKFTKNPT